MLEAINPFQVQDILAVGAILSPVAAVGLSYFLTESKLAKQDIKQQEIHVLVNNRLEEALKKIKHLEDEMAKEIADGEAQEVSIEKLSHLVEEIALAPTDPEVTDDTAGS